MKEQHDKETKPNKKIIFVYNANSGTMNAAFDSMHKVFSPKTYACNLCQLTYGTFNIKKDWKEFLETIKTPIEFLHKNEFLKKFNKPEIELPAIFKENKNNKLTSIVSANEINSIKTLNELKELIRNRLNKTN